MRLRLEQLRKGDLMTPNLVFQDPYILEFLNLNDRYMEKDVEDAIMRELEQFLLELGVGFLLCGQTKAHRCGWRRFSHSIFYFSTEDLKGSL